MTRLRREKINFMRRGQSPREAGRVRVFVPVLVFISVGLLLLSRLNHSTLTDARWRVAEWMSPVLKAAMVPLQPLRQVGRDIAAQVDLAAELQNLKTENEKLNSWEWRARDLERQIADLRALSKVVEEPRLNFVTSRVIADSSGAFVRSVMINAGRVKDVKSGYPVINADGLVGRVTETGANSSRVLLLTDLNSRVPVVIGDKGVRAILAGDNGPQPKLIYIPQDAKILPGDDVSTSGAGGLFPRGLRIGTVASISAVPRANLRAKLDDLDYLSVLFFEDPTRELMGEMPADTKRADKQRDPAADLTAARNAP